ncbi:hypothetical protein SAMN05216389_101227 [Oceanobacillus limi]|uniref:Uncharacterized protein n=1 Tax=Oceanobacillus limi TaxID=930131 RepID=A0A1H9Y6Z8_9BACI|nr:hypothetical protein SAMN05216389_101227 [Oceanobacillus limi]
MKPINFYIGAGLTRYFILVKYDVNFLEYYVTIKLEI